MDMASDRPWVRWLGRRVLPEDEARNMMARFVEGQLAGPQPPASRDEWLAERDALRRRVRQIIGIDDLLPASWPLNIRECGVIERDGYRIEKLTFESYPAMAVPALLYLPDGLDGPARASSPSPGTSTPTARRATMSSSAT